jgi:hypothetical protein
MWHAQKVTWYSARSCAADGVKAVNEAIPMSEASHSVAPISILLSLHMIGILKIYE